MILLRIDRQKRKRTRKQFTIMARNLRDNARNYVNVLLRTRKREISWISIVIFANAYPNKMGKIEQFSL